MSERGSVVWRVLAALILVGVLIAAGVYIYQAGISQGIAQAALVSKEGSPQPVPGYPYYPGFYGPHFGFFPGFSLFGFFFFGLLILFLLRWVFRPWGWRQHGYWHAHPHTHDQGSSPEQPRETE